MYDRKFSVLQEIKSMGVRSQIPYFHVYFTGKLVFLRAKIIEIFNIVSKFYVSTFSLEEGENYSREETI